MTFHVCVSGNTIADIHGAVGGPTTGCLKPPTGWKAPSAWVAPPPPPPPPAPKPAAPALTHDIVCDCFVFTVLIETDMCAYH